MFSAALLDLSASPQVKMLSFIQPRNISPRVEKIESFHHFSFWTKFWGFFVPKFQNFTKYGELKMALRGLYLFK